MKKVVFLTLILSVISVLLFGGIAHNHYQFLSQRQFNKTEKFSA